MKLPLCEYRTHQQANIQLITEDGQSGARTLYLKGICIQADVRNANGRVYPLREISRAVNSLREQIKNGFPVLGEADHPDDLKINLDRVSHAIEDVWMEDNNGCGKLRILPTPMGNLIQVMLDNGVKLGVSSRGSGEVDDNTGEVRDFEIVTVDVVAQPSAPNAYPRAIYESLLNQPGGFRLWQLVQEASAKPQLQQNLQRDLVRFIQGLKL